MRLPLFLGAIAASVLLAGCSAAHTRIRAHKAAFEASPPEVKAKIRRGEIAVGFSTDQVYMALGHPNRVYGTEEPADRREIWVYGVNQGPGFGLSPRYPREDIVLPDAWFEENMRVVFEKGVAVAVVRRLR
jgi:hypothetical protein